MTSEPVEELLARAMHAFRDFGPDGSESVLVVGSQPLSLAALAVIVARGTAKIALVSDNASVRSAASQTGAVTCNASVDAQTVRAKLANALGPFGADLVVECDGTSTSRRLALELARPAGRILLIAAGDKHVSVNPNVLVFGDKRVQGSYGFEPDDLERATALIDKGLLPTSALSRAAAQ